MLHNVDDYDDPESFKPDRFIRDGALNRDIPDPMAAFYGFGRRWVLEKLNGYAYSSCSRRRIQGLCRTILRNGNDYPYDRVHLARVQHRAIVY